MSSEPEPPAGCNGLLHLACDIERTVCEVTKERWDEDEVTAMIERKLAPLFALLKRVPEVFSDSECVLHEGYCQGCTLLADIDAVLGEGDADGGGEEGE